MNTGHEPPIPLVLLPGMDGTGLLFHEFVGALPADITPVVMAYPVDEPMGYAELQEWLSPRLPAGRFAVLGESFSGPLAMRLARDLPERVTALVLVATFGESPIPRWLRRLVSWAAPLLFRMPPPRVGVRLALTGMDAPADLVDRTLAAISAVSAGVLARRARALASLTEQARSPLPTLSLAGRRDRLVSPRHRRGLDLEDLVIDAPHFVLQRRPNECAAAVADLLRGRGSGDQGRRG